MVQVTARQHNKLMKIKHKSGAVEYIPNKLDKPSRDKHKGKKDVKDFEQKDINELVIALAKRAGLL